MQAQSALAKEDTEIALVGATRAVIGPGYAISQLLLAGEYRKVVARGFSCSAADMQRRMERAAGTGVVTVETIGTGAIVATFPGPQVARRVVEELSGTEPGLRVEGQTGVASGPRQTCSAQLRLVWFTGAARGVATVRATTRPAAEQVVAHVPQLWPGAAAALSKQLVFELAGPRVGLAKQQMEQLKAVHPSLSVRTESGPAEDEDEGEEDCSSGDEVASHGAQKRPQLLSRSVQERTGAGVSLRNASSGEICVHGPADAVEAACAMVQRALPESGFVICSRQGPRQSACAPFPAAVLAHGVGKFVGKQGANLRKREQASGARIFIDQKQQQVRVEGQQRDCQCACQSLDAEFGKWDWAITPGLAGHRVIAMVATGSVRALFGASRLVVRGDDAALRAARAAMPAAALLGAPVEETATGWCRGTVTHDVLLSAMPADVDAVQVERALRRVVPQVIDADVPRDPGPVPDLDMEMETTKVASLLGAGVEVTLGLQTKSRDPCRSEGVAEMHSAERAAEVIDRLGVQLDVSVFGSKCLHLLPHISHTTFVDVGVVKCIEAPLQTALRGLAEQLPAVRARLYPCRPGASTRALHLSAVDAGSVANARRALAPILKGQELPLTPSDAQVLFARGGIAEMQRVQQQHGSHVWWDKRQVAVRVYGEEAARAATTRALMNWLAHCSEQVWRRRLW